MRLFVESEGREDRVGGLVEDGCEKFERIVVVK